MARPLVTVGIPVYNAEPFVGRAIESILAQSWRDFELVVVDDGSDDHSRDVIQSYQDKRLRFLQNGENLGLAGVRNRILSEGKGEFLAWLDADDWSHKNRLEKQVDMLRRCNNGVFCGSWFRVVPEYGKAVKQVLPVSADETRCRMLFNNCFVTSATTMVYDQARDKGLQFRAKYAPAEDYAFWSDLLSLGDGFNIPRILCYYCQHGGQSTLKDTGATSRRTAQKEIQRRMLSRLQIYPTEREMLLHLRIGARRRGVGSPAELARAEEWLSVLVQQNIKVAAYPEPAFSKVVASQWLQVCHASACTGVPAFKKYFASQICRASGPPLSGILRFVLRCAVTSGWSRGR